MSKIAVEAPVALSILAQPRSWGKVVPMSAFQPSEHSTYSGAENDTHWYDVLNPVTAYKSYFPSSSSTTAAVPTASSSSGASAAPTAASSTSPATGNYAETGYTYFYNAGDKSITIVMSPKSSTPQKLSNSSPYYAPILAHIKSGEAAPVSSAAVKAERAVKAASSGGGGGSSAPAEPPPGLDLEVPFYQTAWFPYAVLGTVTVIGVLAVLLWPSKKKEHVAAPAPRRQRQIEHKPELDAEYEPA